MLPLHSPTIKQHLILTLKLIFIVSDLESLSLQMLADVDGRSPHSPVTRSAYIHRNFNPNEQIRKWFMSEPHKDNHQE